MKKQYLYNQFFFTYLPTPFFGPFFLGLTQLHDDHAGIMQLAWLAGSAVQSLTGQSRKYNTLWIDGTVECRLLESGQLTAMTAHLLSVLINIANCLGAEMS